MSSSFFIVFKIPRYSFTPQTSLDLVGSQYKRDHRIGPNNPVHKWLDRCAVSGLWSLSYPKCNIFNLIVSTLGHSPIMVDAKSEVVSSQKISFSIWKQVVVECLFGGGVWVKMESGDGSLLHNFEWCTRLFMIRKKIKLIILTGDWVVIRSSKILPE